MSKNNSITLLNALEKEVEEQMKFVLLNFQNMSEQQLLYVPNKDSWSISQCLQHLNSYGEYYLPLLEQEKNRSSKSLPNTIYKSSWIGNYFVNKMDPKRSPKKLKSMQKHIPSQGITAPQIISNHLSQQEALLLYIRIFQTLNLSKRSIPTSLTPLIKLTSMDTLRFLVAHTSRHILQASRVYGS